MPIPPDIENAIVHNNLSVLKDWIDKGRDLTVTNGAGEGLLHRAAYNGRIEALAMLMEAGASLMATDNQSYTPLHEAARNKQVETVRWLLAHGANTAAKTSSGQTPFDLVSDAAGSEGENVRRLLKNATAKPVWQKTGDDEVICVTPKPLINLTITEIFNFRVRTYLLVTENEATKAESAVFRTFSDFTDTQVIEQAEREFTRLGGVLPDPLQKTEKPVKRLTGGNFS